MRQATAGFSFAATAWKTIRKLSQNKPGERDNVARWLARTASPASSFAYWMRKAD